MIDWTQVKTAEDKAAEAAKTKLEGMSLSFAQLLSGLVDKGWITEQEGDAWLEGRIPNTVRQLINQLPQELRFRSRAKAARPERVLRDDMLVLALADKQSVSHEELDEFFTTYAKV